MSNNAKGFSRLHELRKGERGKISKLEGPESVIQRFLEMGFMEEIDVEVVHEAPFTKDPFAVRVRGIVLGISRKEAQHVVVERF